MTLDELIAFEEKNVKENEEEAKKCHEDQIRKMEYLRKNEIFPFSEIDYTFENLYKESAEIHRQIAECLKELKQLREQESKDELKDLSKRVENIEKKIEEDKKEQLNKLQAEIEYAKFCCALKKEV